MYCLQSHLLSIICSSATEEFVQRTESLHVRLMSLSGQWPKPIWSYTSRLWRFANSLVFEISTGLPHSLLNLLFISRLYYCFKCFHAHMHGLMANSYYRLLSITDCLYSWTSVEWSDIFIVLKIVACKKYRLLRRDSHLQS